MLIILWLIEGSKKIMDTELKEILDTIIDELRYRPTPIENVLDKISEDIIGIKESLKALLIEKNQEKLDLPFNPVLLRRIEDCEMSVRAMNGMRRANIVYVGDLIQKTERELLAIPFFGRKCLREIKWLLEQMGLTLGLRTPGWDPETIAKINLKMKANIADSILEN